MKLTFPGAIIELSDNDPRAIKIRQGFGYSYKNGELVVSNQQTELDRESLETKLSAGTATARELQTVLLHLLKKSQN